MPSRFALVKAFWQRLREWQLGHWPGVRSGPETVMSSGPVMLGRDPRPEVLAGRPVSSSGCVAPNSGQSR